MARSFSPSPATRERAGVRAEPLMYPLTLALFPHKIVVERG
jgi:hypothetical protein